MSSDPALAIEIAALNHQKAIKALTERGDSAIQEFFKNATVLITGGSGFLGKLLIEKLFRSCNIKKIFILLRRKTNKTVLRRLETVLVDPVFDSLHDTQPAFIKRLIPIEGDIAKFGLGISEHDRINIIKEVDIIFHLAAATNFNEPLRSATLINVRGTRELLMLAKECDKLRSFVHVSTAYSQATKSNIGKVLSEKFYQCPIQPRDLIRIAEVNDEEKLTHMTEIIKDWPNTYVFTKAIAEEVIRNTAKDLPVSVIRLPYVTASLCEPMPGWLDMSCLNGPTAIITGTALGTLHVLYVRDTSCKLHIIPVDTANNAIIAAAWDTAEKWQNTYKNMEVYTLANQETCLQWSFLHHILKNECQKIVSPKAVWQCYLIVTRNKVLLWTLSCLLHYIPAYFLDGICAIMRRKPKGIQSYAKIFKKMEQTIVMFSYFLNNEFSFQDHNTKALINRMTPVDRRIFKCDTATMDPRQYIKIWYIGIRKYVFKDGLKNSAKGQRRQKMFLIMNIMISMIYLYVFWIVLTLIWAIVKFLASVI